MRFTVVSTRHRSRRSGARDVLTAPGNSTVQWVWMEEVGAYVFQGKDMSHEEFAALMEDERTLDLMVTSLGGISSPVNRAWWKVLAKNPPRTTPKSRAKEAGVAAAAALEGME